MNQIDILNQAYEDYKKKIDKVYGDNHLSTEQKQKEYAKIIEDFETKAKQIVEAKA